MMDYERNQCQVAAAALLGFSRLGFVVFITTPAVFIILQHIKMDVIFICLLSLFLGSVCIVALKSWHIYFDALLFKTLGNGTAGIGEIDLLLLKVFKKDIKDKVLTERIDGCYTLSRSLFVTVGLHVILFCSFIVLYIVHR